MNVFFFSTSLNRDCEVFRETIEAGISERNIVLCRSIGVFTSRLCMPKDGNTLAVLLPANEEELLDIYSIKHLFDGISIVLILPDRDKVAEAIGYRLRPRFMCYVDSNVSEVISVLQNITKSSNRLRLSKSNTVKYKQKLTREKTL